MTTDLKIALPANSFRPEFAAGPSGFRTPSPPADALEPLTPPPWPLTQPQHLLPSRKKRRLHAPVGHDGRLTHSVADSYPTPPEPTSTLLPRQKSAHTPPDGSAPSRPSHPSPTALDVFAAVATSPSLSQGPFSPSIPDQRPASSHYGTPAVASRSHSRNVSEVIYSDSGIAQHPHSYIPSSYPRRQSHAEDAELLLNFSRIATNYRQHWKTSNSHPDGLTSKTPRSGHRNKYGTDYQASTAQASSAMHSWPLDESPETQKKPRVHKGWPKGKPRGKRNTSSAQAQTKKSTQRKPGRPGRPPQRGKQTRSQKQTQQPSSSAFSISFDDLHLPPRPKSTTGFHLPSAHSPEPALPTQRSASVPLDVPMVAPPAQKPQKAHAKAEPKISICSVCNSSTHPNGYHDLWIICNGCKKWFHTICVGFKNEREVRDVDKFYCSTCEPEHGKTTFVRKSSRAHVAVDYAGLNEGQIRAPPDSFEHHFIKPIKEGTISLCSENFPRMPPELVTAEFFERSGTIAEPIVIPAALNPRPWTSFESSEETDQFESKQDVAENSDLISETGLRTNDEDMEWDCVPNDGQDKLDMVMPTGLTVRRVAEILGPDRPLQVIDTKSQDSGDNTWSLGKWADYYEAAGEKPVRNVISLEVSRTKLSRLVRRPKVVRDLDLTDQVWPKEELEAGTYPHVQYYCLMSVADCFTDFHIDFGGSSVFYHILRGKKTFFFIPPKKQHLKKYEEWCISPNQASIWLGDVTKECYRVDLSEGDTMLIPSGWIHAVWTPETSLVIGGNFLTRMHYSMQLQINEIEKNTGVAKMFRYPSFQRVHWYAVLRYLEDDPVPASVARLLYAGGKFPRSIPTYSENEANGDDTQDYFNARFYSQGEIEGLGDVLAFIFRTVMIAIGKIPLPKPKQEAVIRSLPQGYGDHLDLLKTFALWVAWKRGNETLPSWAHKHAPLSELDIALAEKKPGAPTGSGSGDTGRQPKRRGPKRKDPESKDTKPQINDTETNSDPTANPDALIHWCRSCKLDRIFCPHRDPSQEVDILPQFGIKAIISKPSVSPIISDIPMTGVEDSPTEHLSSESTHISPGVDIDPHSGHLTPPSAGLDNSASTIGSHARIKACEECRKSKRRCVHDASGNIDPVKAMQNPVPRAFSATKRIRQEKNVNGMPPNKRIKTSPTEGDDWAPPGFATESPQPQPERLVNPPVSEEVPSTLTMEPISNPWGSTSNLASPESDNVIEQKKTTRGIDEVGVIDTNAAQERSVDNLRAASEAIKVAPEPKNIPSTSTNGEKKDNATTLDEASDAPIQNLAVEANGTKPKTQEPPNEQSEAETQSLTPSLHVQTTSTESIDRSASPPATPLTDLDHSSPGSTTKVDKSNQSQSNELQLNGLVPNTSVFSTDSPEGTSSKDVATRTPKRQAKSERPQSVKSNARSARSGSRKAENSGRLSPREDLPTAIFTGMAETPAMKVEAISPTEETQEDESLRLARELQEQEFGLRRRRSSKT